MRLFIRLSSVAAGFQRPNTCSELIIQFVLLLKRLAQNTILNHFFDAYCLPDATLVV